MIVDLLAPSLFDVAKIVPYADDPWLLVRLHLEWLAFNTILGVVPWVLGRVLFRPGRRVSASWLVGTVAFLLWMPNLAYLLTDVIHIPEAVRDTPSPPIAVAVLMPVFIVFLTGALTGFVDVVRRSRDHFVSLASVCSPRTVEACLCLVAGFGVVVGRATHYQTWDIIRSPVEVVTTSLSALATLDRLLLALLAAAILFVPVRMFDGESVLLRRAEARRSRRQGGAHPGRYGPDDLTSSLGVGDG